MMTVHEVSKKTGVSIRTLHYYDSIGLLSPTRVTESGYRLYDGNALEKLQQILLFKELEFSLKDIKVIVNNRDFDRGKALEQQIELLTLKKEHLEKLINFARRIKMTEVKDMDFSAFDTSKIDEYAKQAKAAWGNTPEYQEYLEKSKGRSTEEKKELGLYMMDIFAEFAKIKDTEASLEQAQALVKRLHDFISENYYTCSEKRLLSLGRMYAGGGSMTENINAVCGKGTAEYAAKAIEFYCKGRE